MRSDTARAVYLADWEVRALLAADGPLWLWRPVKEDIPDGSHVWRLEDPDGHIYFEARCCSPWLRLRPPGAPGGTLVGKEAWQYYPDEHHVIYREREGRELEAGGLDMRGCWRSAPTMPAWAVRPAFRSMPLLDVVCKRLVDLPAETLVVYDGIRDTRPHDPLWDCVARQDYCDLWEARYPQYSRATAWAWGLKVRKELLHG